ncbi:MAG: L-seryl-tRNA(Sec) selenium transferase [Desulfosarcinaceae bacterium]|nr:L-seryl-tRNA(Sec) selenium transferase [Desulfosarcinaceae bacterium]
MPLEAKTQSLLRQLPGVDHLLLLAAQDPALAGVPKTIQTRCLREAVDGVRRAILKSGAAAPNTAGAMESAILRDAKARMQQASRLNLRRTINATGVVVHTNLGRSLLADSALENLRTIAAHYSNLEFDLAKGRRGSRYSAVEEILCELSGAPAAMVVNNNAGAVLLTLDTIARGREVIVSRGELVEIGGAFRIPDVMAKSGGILKEVGTTNRTHARDYEGAIGPQTGLLLKVHTSNYSLVGFTKSVSLKELVTIGKTHGVPVMEDLGSGTLVDFSQMGLLREPTVQQAVSTGVDVITFSGDKLLGGPQTGLILGKRKIIEAIKKNPLTRALRIDKLTLAALEATLQLYRDPQRLLQEVPTLRMLLTPLEALAQQAAKLKDTLAAIADTRLLLEIVDGISRAGGGSLPMLELPTKCVSVQVAGRSANSLESALRTAEPAVIVRIENDALLLDPRTLSQEEYGLIRTALARVLMDPAESPA